MTARDKRTRVPTGAGHAREPEAARYLRQRLRVLLADFKQAHRRGVAALKARDFTRLGAVIARERKLIDEHHRLIAQELARASSRVTTPPVAMRGSRKKRKRRS